MIVSGWRLDIYLDMLTNLVMKSIALSSQNKQNLALLVSPGRHIVSYVLFTSLSWCGGTVGVTSYNSVLNDKIMWLSPPYFTCNHSPPPTSHHPRFSTSMRDSWLGLQVCLLEFRVWVRFTVYVSVPIESQGGRKNFLYSSQKIY